MKKISFFLLLFIIAAIPRFSGIRFHSLWFDEVSTANIVSQSNIPALLKAMIAIEGTPPLFYFLEKAFIEATQQPINEFSLRFLPALFGVLSCILLFGIVYLVSDRKTAFFAFLLIVISSFHVNLSQESRSYSLFGFSVLLMLWLTLLWWNNPSFRRSIVLSGAIVFMTQVHYFAYPVVLAIVGAALIVKRPGGHFYRFFWIQSLSATFSLILLLPLLFVQFSHVASPTKSYLTAKWAPGTLYAPIKVMLGAYLFKIKTLAAISISDLAGIIAIIVILATACCLLWRQYRVALISEGAKLVIACFILVYCFHIAIGWKIPSVHPRYMAHILTLLFGIIMVATMQNKKIQLVFFIAIVGFNILGNANYFNASKSYIEPWREVGRIIDSTIGTNNGTITPIIVPHTAIGHPVAFYCGLKQMPVYVIELDKSQTTFAHLRMFGHDYFTSLNFFTYNPIAGTTSYRQIARSYRNGLFVHLSVSSKELLNELQKNFDGILTFTTLKAFKTNQGEISVFHWYYMEQDVEVPEGYAAKNRS